MLQSDLDADVERIASLGADNMISVTVCFDAGEERRLAVEPDEPCPRSHRRGVGRGRSATRLGRGSV